MTDAGQVWRREEDDDSEQEVDETVYKAQKDAILLAIEVRETMLAAPPESDSKNADRDSPLEACLKCAYQLMEQRIISNPKDMMGILLFGTKQSRFQDESRDNDMASRGYPNCYLLTDLNVPSAEDVKRLKSIVEGDEDAATILQASGQPISMSNVLFCANQIFTTKAANFGSRRLFILTDNDSPHAEDKSAASAAAVRAKDLYDLGITIDLFPITTGSTSFDFGKFYDDIVYQISPAEENTVAVPVSKASDGLTLFNSLISNINSKQAPKRALFSNVPFEIAPGLRISVKGYNILHRQTPSRTCYVWLDGEKAQLATRETTTLAEDNARSVDKQEIQRAYRLGGEYVFFSPEEQKTLRDFGAPVIRIIGFKPRKCIPVWASVKKSTFIFPSEEDYVGSSRVFSALWQKLLQDDKVGIAWCVVRANAQPVLAAIFPSREVGDVDSGAPDLPAGLWIHPLPFADDIREAKLPTLVCRSSDELTTLARKVSQQLQLPKAMYKPTKYANPALQWHYKILKALALEEEVPEKAEDATEPRFRAINRRAGGYIEEWAAKLEEEAGMASDVRTLKREVDGINSERAPKQRRTTGVGEKAEGAGMTLPQLRLAIESGGIERMTLAQLREVALSKGLSSSGRKKDLVYRITRWVDDRGGI